MDPLFHDKFWGAQGLSAVRFCSFFCAVVRKFLILSCGIVVLQDQAVCDILVLKFLGNFNAVYGSLILFCAVFMRNSLRFCGIRTLLTFPS